MMKLSMAPFYAYLKPTIGFEQSDQFLDLHLGILARGRDRGLTSKVTGADETLAITSAAGRRPVDREVRLAHAA
jgi:hypothetical protein